MQKYSLLSNVSQQHFSNKELSIPTQNYNTLNPPRIPSKSSSSKKPHKVHIGPPHENRIFTLILPKNLLHDWMDHTKPLINMNYLISLVSPLW
jgi:hypothetical protein